MKVTLAQVKTAQPDWFSRGNKRLFGDIKYKVLQGKASGKSYLVRATYMWSDMFGQPKQICYRINPINQDTLTIEGLIDNTFRNMEDVREWLRAN